MDDTLYNYVFSGLSLEKINKIPKWMLENLENNKPLIEKFMAKERLKVYNDLYAISNHPGISVYIMERITELNEDLKSNGA